MAKTQVKPPPPKFASAPAPANGFVRRTSIAAFRGAFAASVFFALCLPRASAQNGNWINATSGGLWSNSANWSGGVIADGTDAIADFSTLDITADNTVHLDSARTVGTLLFADTMPSNNWTLDNDGIGSDALTLGVSSGTPLIQVNNQTATISAAVAGTQGFIKSGDGALVLSGANTISGTVTLSSGTTRLTNASAMQNATVALNIDGGLLFSPSIGAFTLGGLSGATNLSLADTSAAPITLSVGKNNGSTNYSGSLGGPGSLTKIGTGTLTLLGANTFSGAATVSAGALQLGVADTLQTQTVVVNGSGALKFSPSIGTFTLGGLSGIHGFALTDTSGNPITLQIGGNNASTTFTGVLSGTGSVTKVGTGILTLTSSLDSYSGNTIVSAGAVDGKLGNSTVVVNVDGGLVFSSTAYSLGAISGPGNVALASVAGAAVSLSVGNNNSTTTYSGILSGSGSLSKFGSGTLTLNGINTYSGPTLIDGGVILLGTGATIENSVVTVSADNGLQFNAGVDSVTLSGLSGASNVSLTDTNGAPVALQVGNNDASFEYDGVMSGTGSLTKIGAGTFTLLGGFTVPNSYTGGTFVDSGTLALAGFNSAKSAVTGIVTVNDGTVLLSTASAGKSCSVIVNVDGGLTFTPSVGTFTLGALLGAGNFALVDSNSASITLSVGSGNASTTYSGVMSGSGGLTKIGTGILTLTSVQTYTGTTTISAGSLELANANALRNSTVVSSVNGGLSFAPSIGTFTIGGLSAGSSGFSLTDSSGAPIVLQVGSDNASTTATGGLTGSGGLNKIGSGTLTFSGANTFTGDTTVSAGSLILGYSDSLENSTYNSIIPNALTFTTSFGGANRIGGLSGMADLSVPAGISLSVGNNNTNTLYSGVLSGAGAFTKIGSGTLTLSGACTLSGGVAVNLGAVELASANALQSTTADIEVNGGLTFGTGIGIFTIGGLGLSAGLGQVVDFALIDSAGAPVTLQVGNDNANTTYWGTMSGAGALIKIGSGTLTLNGANTFSGNTTISAGAVQFGNAEALQNSTVVENVNNGLKFPSSAATFTIGGLSGVGGFSLLTSALIVGGNNASTFYSGVISDTSSLNFGSIGKNGTGTLTLAGANTYHGFTTINAGVVQLANANAVQNSFVAVNVNGGLAFSPGIGTFTVGGLSGTGTVALTDTSGAPVNLQVNNNDGGFQLVVSNFKGNMNRS